MRFLLMTLTLLLTSATFAQTKLDLKTVKGRLAAIESTSKKCFNKAVSNNDMKQCAFGESEQADKLLNEVYRQLVSSLKTEAEKEKNLADYEKVSQETLNRLVASERAWIAYRDTQCSYAGTEMLNGSGEGLIVVGCLATKTQDRIKEIMTGL